MTLAELTLMGVPAILVPLPTASEGHQEHNARAMERSGAGRLLLQSDLDGASLSRLVAAMAADSDKLEEMAEKSRGLAVPDAADRIVDELERVGLLKGTADGRGRTAEE